MNDPIGRARVVQSGTRTTYGIRDGRDGLILTDDTLVQLVLHVQKLLALARPAYAVTGMPVQRDTTSAISCASTSSLIIGLAAGAGQLQLLLQGCDLLLGLD